MLDYTKFVFVFQMLDLVSPAQPDCVSLRDLKRCQMASIFFNTFFNLDKYLDMEQRDPFSNLKVCRILTQSGGGKGWGPRVFLCNNSRTPRLNPRQCISLKLLE